MTIEEQLREFARRADQQPAITAAEIVEHADHGVGPFTTHSSANGQEVLDQMPLQFTHRDANVIDLEAPGSADERSEGSKRVVMARLLAVAAATIVVVGVAAIAFTVGSRTANDPDGVPQAPAPTAAPTTTVAPRTYPTDGSTGEAEILAGLPITYTLPDGWTVPPERNGFVLDSGSSIVNIWDVDNVYADGCEHTLHDPPLGRTVDDLANVWATLAGFTATTPVDVTVDGYAGKRVDYTVPDYVQADCVNRQFALWTERGQSFGGPSFWAQVPGQQNRQWIIDVDGERLVINEWSAPGTTPEQLAGMDQFLASIQIG